MTDIEIVRFKIGDSDSALIAADATIQAFITRNGDDLNLAAAELLESMAADSILLDKAISIDGYSHDRKGIVANFLSLAKSLRATAEETPAIGKAEIAHDDFTRDTIIHNKAERE